MGLLERRRALPQPCEQVTRGAQFERTQETCDATGGHEWLRKQGEQEQTMADAVAPRLGLYYPFIQFRSDAWLKLAALYWDQIGRIVPPGYEAIDSETVRRLQGELGFVTNLAPSERVLDRVSSEFLDLIDAHGQELTRFYGTESQTLGRPPPRGQQWPPSWSNLPTAHLPHARWQGAVDPSQLTAADPRLAYIYADGKMAGILAHTLIDSGLGVAVPRQRLIGLHPQLAFVYMHVLARRMATSAIYPLTDDDFDHVASGCSADSIAEALLGLPSDEPTAGSGSTDEPALQFAMLAIQSVIPKDIDSIPVQKIIEIRRDHADELVRFQQVASELVASIPEAIASADRQVCSTYLQALANKTLQPELRQLKEHLRRAGVDSIFGAMSVRVQAPQLLTSGAALLGIGALHLNPVMMGSGAIVLCLVPRMRRQKDQARTIRADSPAAYLLRLQEELSPTSLADSVTIKARHLLAA